MAIGHRPAENASRPGRDGGEVLHVRRILVTGLAGAGKTTFARRLSLATGIPWWSLDDLYYGPGLTMAATFPAAVERITAHDDWIFDSGGPPPTNAASIRLRDLMWSRADTLLWLDYSQPIVLWRATTRSLRRIITRQRLWHGYRDTPAQWLRDDHPIRRAWSTHRRRREDLTARLAHPSRQALSLERFHHPDQAEAFLNTVAD
jgi:adenylate kinase family enzyme